MAIHWGAWEGGTYTGFRVGIDVSVSPSSPSHSDTSVTVTIKWYVQSSGSVNDDMTFHKGGDADGDIDFHFSAGNGTTTKLIATSKPTYGISYSSSGTKTYTASLSGVYNGATPSATKSVNLPERPAAAPDKPNTPTIAADGPYSLHVGWSKPDGNGDSVDYMQYQLDNNSSFSSPVDTHTDNATPSSSSGLKPYTVYYARVRAHNSKGYGPWSNTVSVRTDGIVPAKPTFVISGQGSPSTLLSTNKIPNATPSVDYVQIQVDTQSNMSSPFLTYNDDSPSSTGLSTLHGWVPGNKYYIRMRCHNAQGYGAWTAIKSFTIAPGFTIPTAPRTPTISAITKNTATLAWVAPSSNGGNALNSYTIHVSGAALDDDLDDDVDGSTLTYNVTGLKPGKTFGFSVIATNDAGDSPSASSATATSLMGFKRWNGSAWVEGTIARRWDGTAWVDISNKKWNGSAWV